MILEKSYLMMIVITSDQEKMTIQFRTGDRDSSLRGSNNAPSVSELIQATSPYSLQRYNFYPETVD